MNARERYTAAISVGMMALALRSQIVRSGETAMTVHAATAMVNAMPLRCQNGRHGTITAPMTAMPTRMSSGVVASPATTPTAPVAMIVAP